MKSYPSLNSDMGCGNGWSSIFDLCVAWTLDVKHPRFLALCIRRTPVLSVKIRVKKCVLNARKYGRLKLMNRVLLILQLTSHCSHISDPQFAIFIHFEYNVWDKHLPVPIPEAGTF